MNQEDLEKYGFSYRYYGRIERGLANVTLDTLIRICNIFEVKLSDLFAFMDAGEGMSEDREAVAVKVNRVLAGKNKKRVQRLKVFLDEILETFYSCPVLFFM